MNTRAPSFVRAFAISIAFALALLFARSASAHQVGLSRGEYRASDNGVRADVTLSYGDMQSLVETLELNGQRKISQAELDREAKGIQEKIVDRVVVTSGGAPCKGTLESAMPDDVDGVRVTARYACASPAKSVSIELALLDDLSHGHRHIAKAFGGREQQDLVLFAANKSFAIDVVSGRDAAAATEPRPAYKGKLSFFPLGIEHILTGTDHLVFLLGLVLIGGRLKDLLATITAFTVAHSISLALAVLGILAPSPRVVEPAIALSIAYVGVENFFVKDGKKRWRITFPFGLIHGFGFAGALQEISMPRADLPWALVLFNLGVEAGQLMVLAVILPMILLARRQDRFRKVGVRMMSAAIVTAGVVWFVLRAFVQTA